MFKTIIIGAGPAGLIAGKYLKDALVLDKKREIGKPVQCAEALSKEFLEKEGIIPDQNWISAVIDTTEIVVPSGKKILIQDKELGFILDRPIFEKSLAKNCKAKIQLQTKVVDVKKEGKVWQVKTDRGEIFQSEYLIGADGPLSIVRRKIFNEKIGILPTFEYLVELEKEINTSAMRMYFDNERFPSGYAWIFPKSKTTANIGLGGKKRLDLKFEDFMKRTVTPEFGNYKLLENRSGTLPWGGAKITLFKDNVFLTGDAGGLADPITGGGIGNAMVSARIAAECILSGQPQLYEKKLKSLPPFSTELLVAQKILYSLPNPVLDQAGEVLENKNVFYLKTLPGLLSFLSKRHLRRNWFKILRLLLILGKNSSSFA